MATECPVKKVDSNVTSLSFAEEVCLKVLPSVGAGDPSDPVWYGLEPNSYAEFGGEQTFTARAPITISRQNKKGVPTDLDASGGFNTDFTRDNLTRLFQGFWFANVREKATTVPMNAAKIVVSAATAATDKYTTSATAIAFNKVGLLVKASGFALSANNGLHVVASADADDITVGNGLADEGAAPAVAKIEAVGYEFATADAAIALTGNVVTLTSAANILAGLGLIAGEWIFIGGDTLAVDRFANNVGFARIKTIAAGVLTFDDVSFVAVNEVSTGKKIRIFFGTVLKNEATSVLIKRRSYQLERTLGLSPAGDVQAEYLEGAIPNELTVNIPTSDKITADLTFVACNHTYRTGVVDDEAKSEVLGTTVAALGQDAINSTSNVYRLKMSVHDDTDSNPDALFGYITEGNIAISNGVTPNKAVGVFGAFDASAGNFVVSGSLTAYFTTIEAVKAVRSNADVGFSFILTGENAGQIFDIPLLGLGGGKPNVEKDQPITIPLEPQGAENANGYTMLYNSFPYLPSIAMP